MSTPGASPVAWYASSKGEDSGTEVPSDGEQARGLRPPSRQRRLWIAAAAAILLSACQPGPVSAATTARPDGGNVKAISCASARYCAAAGELDFPHATGPLLVTEKNGTWGKARTVPGLSALLGGEHLAELVSVSCSSAGNCGPGRRLLPAERFPAHRACAGVRRDREERGWGGAKAVPGLAALNAGGSASVDLMSCESAGSCTAAGTCRPDHLPGCGCGRAFVVSETNGTWRKAEPIRSLPRSGIMTRRTRTRSLAVLLATAPSSEATGPPRRARLS